MNTFTENKLIHVPVTITPEDIKYEYPSSTGKQCSWWSDNSLLPYNAMLVSAYHGMDRITDRSKIRDDVLFLGDSGGFQVLQNKLGNLNDPNISEKLTWEKVIKWQLGVCDIAMTLDIPTPRAWVQINDRKIFEERLKESKENAIEMLRYTEKNKDEMHNPNFRLFNCIHGVFLDDMERWYKETTENHDYEYDGFSLSTSAIMKSVLALRLGFAMEHSTGKPYHLLGVSAPQPLTLIAYANKFTDTQVYFDSSSASTGRMIRKYMIFWNFSGNGMTLKENLGENPKYKGFQTFDCPCPVCRQLERPSDLWELKTLSGILISIHNLFWMTNHTEFLNNLVKCEDEFLAYVKMLTREPPDSPYTLPENMERYVAGMALEQGDGYNLNEAYNLNNDLNLSINDIPMTAPVIARDELQRERKKMSMRYKGSSWVLRYMNFLDCVHEEGLEKAWLKFFKRVESNDSYIMDESDTDVEAYCSLHVEENKKMRNVMAYSTSSALRAVRNAMKAEILDPCSHETVKTEELFQQELAEVSGNKSKKNSKKRAPIVDNEFFE